MHSLLCRSTGNPLVHGVGVLIDVGDPQLVVTGQLLKASPFSSTTPKALSAPSCVGDSSRAAVDSVMPQKKVLVAKKISVYLLFLPLATSSVAVRSSSPFLAVMLWPQLLLHGLRVGCWDAGMRGCPSSLLCALLKWRFLVLQEALGTEPFPLGLSSTQNQGFLEYLCLLGCTCNLENQREEFRAYIV